MLNKKKTILHVIDYMGRGGAETMLVQVLKQLKEYNNIVVTVNEQNNFGEYFECDEHYCLKMGSFKNFLFAAHRLKKFIKQRDIDIVHSHLLLSTLITRIASPKNIPLITTIHTSVAFSKDYNKWYLKWLEKITYQFHKNIIVGVSKSVLQQYFTHLKHKVYKSYLVYTFVDIDKFKSEKKEIGSNEKAVCKLVSVGALRYPKNQLYIINALKKLDSKLFEYHIYGSGVQEPELKAAIVNMPNVVLKGEVDGINKLLSNYDIYVMPSKYEGFSLSILEAMAMQMPLFVSDIPSFKEQCEDVAEYFDLNNEDDVVKKLQQLAQDKSRQTKMGIMAKERAEKYFTLQHHMQGIRNVYTETLNITPNN